MNDQDVAGRLIDVAKQHGDSFLSGQIDYKYIQIGFDKGWLQSVGIGHFQITNACIMAGSQVPGRQG